MTKLFLGAAIAALLATPVVAQDRPHTVTLGERDIIYMTGLVRRQPYEEAAPVLNRVQAALDAEAAKAAEEAKKKAAADAKPASEPPPIVPEER